MDNNHKIHNRKSIRLTGFDYSKSGVFYITICTYQRKHLFGKIKNCKMILNYNGNIANECWQQIPQHFPNVILDEYVIMPDHMHGIIKIVENINDRGEKFFAPTNIFNSLKNHNNGKKSEFKSPSKTVGSIIRGFKIGVTKILRKSEYNCKVWQRNYYERIVRSEKDLERIRKYIKDNPKNW